MKLHLHADQTQHLITGLEDGAVFIHQQRYAQNIIVFPQHIITPWKIGNFKSLSPQDFAVIIDFHPEIVLLGTGKTHQFLHPDTYRSLTELQIAVEFMTTAAACRTYNILISEGRHVAAALIIED